MTDKNAEEQRCRLAAFLVTAGAAATAAYSQPWYERTPYHTSELTGRRWLDELFNGHSNQMLDNLGIRAAVFTRLCNELAARSGLQGTRGLEKEERVAIFLYLGRHAANQCALAERFQHSGDTISRCVYCL